MHIGLTLHFDPLFHRITFVTSLACSVEEPGDKDHAKDENANHRIAVAREIVRRSGEDVVRSGVDVLEGQTSRNVSLMPNWRKMEESD